ncbi:MAG TPA: NifB/NifX family molybdenum-iron cluster-binding protein [Tepidisphaeraceae bacterium]|nr:NifB/NifX family molybdenum-iron cluster-binding protein [Tepidisphaeraceae bacterium]
MRIAVPLSGGVFNQHFGQSTAFWICDVQQNPLGVSDGRELPMPEGEGCGVIPAMLSQAGVNLVIAGGMGAGAVQNLARCGIEVITGVSGGTPQQIVQEYLAGRLVSTGQLCQHHEGHGEHGHGGCHGHRRD